MENDTYFTLEALISRLETVLKPETIDELVGALSQLPINDDCDIITLRRCRTDSHGLPVLEADATWSKSGLYAWEQNIVMDEDSLGRVWILSNGPPMFIEDYREFALFTDASRQFYMNQGVISLYRILVRRNENCTGVLTVMWTTPHVFSDTYKATIEFMSWLLLPVLENIYYKEENRILSDTITHLEQKLMETEGRIHALVHDLKQPLTSIVTTASLLNDYIDRLDKNQIATKLNRVLQDSKGMSDWITSILLLAQVRSDHVTELQNLAMQKVLTETISTMNGFIGQSSAQISYTSIDDSIWVQGEPTWLSHIWMNLISNACKYGGTPPIISITASDLQDKFRFTVNDNGSGIPQDKLHLVFEPFARFSREKSGTGIGLTTIKMLAERMGGEVGVETGATGSTFWFTLNKALPHTA